MLATSTETVAVNAQSMLERLQRSEISNPPAFGAKVASNILRNNDLRHAWYADLKTMSERIRSMRKMLYDGLVSQGMHVFGCWMLGALTTADRCPWLVGPFASPIGNVWILGSVARCCSQTQRLVEPGSSNGSWPNADLSPNRGLSHIHGEQFSSVHRGFEYWKRGICCPFDCRMLEGELDWPPLYRFEVEVEV